MAKRLLVFALLPVLALAGLSLVGGSTPAHAVSYAFVQGAAATSPVTATTLAVSTTVAATRNNKLVVAVLASGTTTSSVSDNAVPANTYTRLSNLSIGAGGVETSLWAADLANVPAGTLTVTATYAIAAFGDLEIQEYSGLRSGQATLVDVSATKLSAAGVTTDSVSITPTGAGELVLGLFGDDGMGLGTAYTPGAAFTARNNIGPAGGLLTEELTTPVGAGTAVTVNNAAGNNNLGIIAVVLRLPAAAGNSTVYALGDICSDPYVFPTDTACDDVANNLLPTAGTSAIVTVGDHQYNTNTIDRYNARYVNNVGNPARKALTHPATGNHEYEDLSAEKGYCTFFGTQGCTGAAGSRTPTWYSWDLGQWHFVSIDSMQDMSTTSAQYAFVNSDLAAHASSCKVLYWHHPHYTSGNYWPSADSQVVGMQDLWNLLTADKADLVLNGHDHVYERFAKQNASGGLDPVAGAREFIVGTGGASQYVFHSPPLANSEFRYNASPGVLKLTLHQDTRTYDWSYSSLNGGVVAVQDSGTAACN